MAITLKCDPDFPLWPNHKKQLARQKKWNKKTPNLRMFLDSESLKILLLLFKKNSLLLMVQKSEPTSWYIGGGLSPTIYNVLFIHPKRWVVLGFSETIKRYESSISPKWFPPPPPVFRSSNWKSHPLQCCWTPLGSGLRLGVTSPVLYSRCWVEGYI